MLEIRIKDERSNDNRLIGFLRAEDKERDLYLHCKIYIYTDNSITLEKFLNGFVGKYEFKALYYERDTLFFRGRGRGRKPEWAEAAMADFIREVQRETNTKTINFFIKE